MPVLLRSGGYGWEIINMDNEKCVTVYYHGDEYDSAIDRELKQRGLKHGDGYLFAGIDERHG